jgi:glutathione S-transferase
MEPVNPVVRSAAINQEVERIEVIFAQAQGEFMFSQSTIVDAFYAILAYRLQSYGISLSGRAGEYQHSLLNWSLLQRAIQENIGWGSSSE